MNNFKLRTFPLTLILTSIFLLPVSRGNAVTIPPVTPDSKIYIVGGGLAGLSAAVYAIQDGKVAGKNIHILEELSVAGGALDSKGGTQKKPYAARGARLVNHIAHQAYFDFLARIPSLDDQVELEKLVKTSEEYNNFKPKKNLYDEMSEFSAAHKLNSITRLVGKEQLIIDHTDFRLSFADRYDFLKLVLTSEENFQGKRIDEYFQPSFFKTKFWHMFASIFGFDTWHSLSEMRRYLRNYFFDLDTIADLEKSGWNTTYNTYESVVVPTLKWLGNQGVNFHMGCKVTDIDFKPGGKEKTVEKIHFIRNGKNEEITVKQGDFAFVTIGSKTADSREGTMEKAPETVRTKVDGAWTLWENILKKQPDLGNPGNFTSKIDQSKFVVFNLTSRGKLLENLIMKFTKNKKFGEQHMVIFTESPWNLIIHLPWQPFVKNQDEDTTIFMAYGLYVDREGDYVKKKMSECNGEELLTEMSYQFGFMKELPEILKTTTSVPYMLPYVTSMFLPRNTGDRPPVVPEGSTNLAFLGEYTEIPDESVFMVSYSCKSAQIGVYKLLNVDKEVTPNYTGLHNPWNWIKVLSRM